MFPPLDPPVSQLPNAQCFQHLQAIKLLWMEQVKTNTRVHFVAGDRMLEYLGNTVDRVSELRRTGPRPRGVSHHLRNNLPLLPLLLSFFLFSLSLSLSLFYSYPLCLSYSYSLFLLLSYSYPLSLSLSIYIYISA